MNNYNYSIEKLFKIICKYQCKKLIKLISLNYKIDNIENEIKNIYVQIDKLDIIINLKKKIPPKKKKIPINKYRCQARIYNYHNLINIKKNGTLKIGTRCKRKLINNTKYCLQHNKSLTHGNYLKNPSEYIKNHYIKGYKYYIKKENIPLNNIININDYSMIT